MLGNLEMGPDLRRGDTEFWNGAGDKAEIPCCFHLMGKTYFVYIMANRKHGTVYTGVTNDLVRRAYEHREGLLPGFTKEHDCKHLVWFEVHGDIDQAILREKRIKDWKRDWKDRLIEERNPNWQDLWWEISGQV